MKSETTCDRLELTEKRDGMDIGLGVILALVAVACCYGVPKAYTEVWSYKFGMNSYPFRLGSAIIGIVVGIVACIGSMYTLFKQNIHSFDKTHRKYEGGEYLFSRSVMVRTFGFDEIDRVVIVAKGIGDRKTYWVCLLLHNRERMYVGERFNDLQAVQQIAGTIAECTGCHVDDETALHA